MTHYRHDADWASDARGDQRYTGASLFADSWALRKSPLLGQVSRTVEGKLRARHGRYLAGLGGEQPDGQVGYDPAYQDALTYELEQQDDNLGSGIFDPGSRPGTANANMGVFASHYSWPGYLARWIPFTVSRDVSDITDDAEVVYVPGGGMAFVEEAGRLRRPAVTGPTWRPKALTPAGVTSRDQPYAFLNRPGQPYQPPLNPNAPVTGVPTYGRPARVDNYPNYPVPQAPPSCRVPRTPGQHNVPLRSSVQPNGGRIAIRPPAACSGVGADDGGSTGKALAAGVVAGAAAGLLWLAVKKKR